MINVNAAILIVLVASLGLVSGFGMAYAQDAPTVSYTALTTNSTNARITFAEPVSGTYAKADWMLNGVILRTTGLNNFNNNGIADQGLVTTLTINIPPDRSFDVTASPTVIYSGTGLKNAENALVSSSPVTAVSGVFPRIVSTEFSDANTIVVTLSEDILQLATDSFSESGGTSLGTITTTHDDSSTMIVLATANAATSGTAYTINHPALVDSATNTLAAGTFTVTYTVPLTIASAFFTHPNIIEITLSDTVASVSGTFSEIGGSSLGTITAAHTPNTATITLTTENNAAPAAYQISHPAISEISAGNIDVTRPAPFSAVVTLAGQTPVVSLTFSEDLDFNALPLLADWSIDGMSVDDFTTNTMTSGQLVFPGLDRTSTPSVSFSGESRDAKYASGYSVVRETVMATNIIAPTFSAATTALYTVTITFDRVVEGTTSQADWTIGGAAPTEFSETLNGNTLEMTYPASPVLSGTPDVVYSGSSIEGVNDVALESATVSASDGIAPTITSIQTVDSRRISITFSELVLGSLFALEWTIDGNVAAGTTLIAASELGPNIETNMPFDQIFLFVDEEHDFGTRGDGFEVRYVGSNQLIIDVSSKPLDTTTIPDTTDGISPTFTAALTGPNTIVVTFSEPVTFTGSADLTVWATNTDPSTNLGSNPALTAITAPADEPISFEMETTITLTTSIAYSSTNLPDVYFFAVQSFDLVDESDNPIVINGEDNFGQMLYHTVATDGLAPTFEAAAISPTVVSIRYDRNVVGDSVVADWNIGNTPPTVIDLMPADSTHTSTEHRLTFAASVMNIGDGVTTVPDGLVLTYTGNTVANTVGTKLVSATTAPITDGIGPTYAAVLTGPNTIVVTFTEPIDSVRHDPNNAWRANNVSVVVVPGVGDTPYVGVTSITITTAATFSSENPPLISILFPNLYTDEADNSPRVNRIDGGNVYHDVQSTDGIAPTISSVSFNNAGSVITLTLSEALAADTVNAAGAFSASPTLGMLTPNPAYVDGTTLMLTVGTAPTVTGTFTITPSDVTDLAGNVLGNMAAMFTALEDLPSPTFSAVTTDINTVTVTFDDAVSGETADSEWTVGGNAVTVGETTLASDTTLVLTLLTAIETGDTPAVVYTRPAAPNTIRSTATGTGILGDDVGSEVTVTPSDGIAPTYEAFLTAINTDNDDEQSYISIRYSENVLNTDKANWHIGATKPSYVNNAGDGVHPHEHVLVVPDLTSSMTYVGMTIRYSGDVGDAATNSLPMTDVTIQDDLPPTFTAVLTMPNEITVTFSEPIDSTPGSHNNNSWLVSPHTGIDGRRLFTSMHNPSSDLNGVTTVTVTTVASYSSANLPVIYLNAPQEFMDAAGNPIPGVADGFNTFYEVQTTDGLVPTFTAATYNSTDITISFSSAVSGMINPVDWEINDNDITSLQFGNTVTSVQSPANSKPFTVTARESIVIRLPSSSAFDTSSTPKVEYKGTSLMSSSGNMLAVPMATVTATDMAGATFTGHAVTSTQVIVRFNENVSGNTDASHWTVNNIAVFDTIDPTNPRTLTLDYKSDATGEPLGAELRYIGDTLTGPETPTGIVVGANGELDSNGVPTLGGDRGTTIAEGVAPTFTAESTSNDRITITFNESVTGTTSASDWTIDGDTSSNAVFRFPNITSGYIVLPSSTFLRVPHDPIVEYTGTGIRDLAGNQLMPATTTTVDGIGPQISGGATHSSTIVDVVFNEPVRGTFVVSEWSRISTAGASTTMAVSASSDGGTTETTNLSDVTNLRLTFDEKLGTSHDVTIQYTGSSLTDEHGNAFGNFGRVVDDGAPPEITGARTDTVNQIEVTFDDEPIGTSAPSDWSVVDNVVMDVNHAGTLVTLVLRDDIETDATPEVTYSGVTLSDSQDPPNRVMETTVTPRDGIAPTFTAELTSRSRAVVTFSEPVSWTGTVNQWSVDHLESSTVETTDPTSLSNMREIVLNAKSNFFSRVDNPVVAFFLPNAAASAYMDLSDTAGNNIMSTGFLPGDTPFHYHGVDARDGVPPTFTAVLTGPNTIVVTFSEPVNITEDRSQVEQWATNLDPSTNVGPNASSEILSIPTYTTPTGTVTTLTLTTTPTYSSANLPDVYYLPAGILVIRDKGNNPLPTNGLFEGALPVYHTVATDGIAPTFEAVAISSTVVSIRYDKDVVGNSVVGDWNIGSTPPINIVLSPSDSTHTSTEHRLTFAAGVINADVDTTTVPDGLMISYTGTTVEDSAANDLEMGDTPITDGISPTFTATVTSANTIVIEFTEAVTNAHITRNFWDVDGTLVMSVQPSSLTEGTVLTLTLAPGNLVDFSAALPIVGASNSILYVDTSNNELPDTVNAMFSSTHEVQAIDGAPPTFTAKTKDAKTVVITFDKPVTGTLDRGNWQINAGTTDAITALSMGDTVLEISTVRAFSTDATPSITYIQGNIEASANNMRLASGSMVSTDGAPPTFTAETESTTTVRVTFSEALGVGDTAFSEWTVEGNEVTAVDLADDKMSFVLTSDAFETGATPEIIYTGSSIGDAASNVVEAATLDATDGVGPVIMTEAFDTSADLNIVFSEPVRIPEGTFSASPDLGVVTVTQPSVDTTTLVLSFATRPTHMTTYMITYPEIADRVSADNTLASGTFEELYTDTTPPTFTAATTSSNTITVTFSEPVTGTLVMTDWTVSGGLSVSNVSVIADSVSEVFGMTSAFTITVTGDAIGVAQSDLTVSYATTSGDAIVDTAGNSLAAATATPVADGIAPTFTAAFTDANTIELTISEALNSIDAPPPFANTDLNLGPHGYTATTEANGDMTFVITLTAMNAAIDGTTYTITYPDLGDASRATLEGGTFTVQYLDETAPTFTAKTTNANTITVTFDEPVRGTPVMTDWTLNGGLSVSRVSGIADNAFTITVTGGTIGVAQSDLLVSYVTTSGQVIEDMSMATNDLVAAADVPVTDGFAAFMASLTSNGVITITFGETVSGTTIAGDWDVAGHTIASIAPTGSISGTELVITLTDTMQSTGIMPTITYTAPPAAPLQDGAGNALASEGNMQESVTTDALAPSMFSNARFVQSNVILVDLSESIMPPTAGSFTAAPTDIGVLTIVYTTGTTLALQTATPATDGTMYTVTHPAVQDLASNELASGTFTVTYDADDLDTTTPTFSAAYDVSSGATSTITVTFSEGIFGTTVAGDWSVFTDTTGTSTGVTSVSPLTLAGQDELVITVDAAINAGDLRYVTYTSNSRELADSPAEGNAVADAALVPVSDGVIPTFTAVTSDVISVVVTFDTPITGTANPSNWTIGGEAVVVVDPVMLEDDTELTLRLANIAAFSVTTIDVTSEAAIERIDQVEMASFGTGGTPTVAYVGSDENPIADVGGDVLDDASVVATDGIAPTFSAVTMSANTIRVTFSEPVSGTTVASHWAALTNTDSSASNTVSSITTDLSAGHIDLTLDSPLDTLTETRFINYTRIASATDMLISDSANNRIVTMVRANVNALERDPAGVPLYHSVPTSDGIPPTFTARTMTSTTIKIDFSELVNGSRTSNWFVNNVEVESFRNTESAYIYEDELLTISTPLDTDATPMVSYRITGGDGEISDMDGNEILQAVTVTATDGAPPTFMATLTTPNNITLEFSEAVSGTTSISDWSVDGKMPIRVDPRMIDGTMTELTLEMEDDIADELLTNAMPRIIYTAPSESPIVDVNGNPLAAERVGDVIDDTDPRLLSAAFEYPNVIIVQLSEPIVTPASAFTAAGLGTLTTSYTQGATSLSLFIETGTPVDGTEYTITHPALTDVADSPNTGPSSSITTTYRESDVDSTPPTFTASILTPETIVLTFSEPVYGPTVATDWTITNPANTVSDVSSDTFTGQTELVITVNTLAPTDTPTVTYGGTSLDDYELDGGNVITDGTSAVATDTTPPMIDSAVTTSTGVTVTFSEDVEGTTSLTDWTVNGANPTAFGTQNGDTITLSGNTVSLTVKITNTDGTLDTGATPTVTVSSTMITDFVGNPIRTSNTMATDGAPPTINEVIRISPTRLLAMLSEPTFLNGAVAVTIDGTAQLFSLIDGATSFLVAPGTILTSGTTAFNIQLTNVADGDGNMILDENVPITFSNPTLTMLELTATEVAIPSDLDIPVELTAPRGESSLVVNLREINTMAEGGTFDQNIVIDISSMVELTLPQGVSVESFGTMNEGEILVESLDRDELLGKRDVVGPADDMNARDVTAFEAFTAAGPTRIANLGNDLGTVLFSEAVSVRMDGVGSNAIVYYVDLAGGVHGIDTCESSTDDDISKATETIVPVLGSGTTAMNECYVQAGGDIVIWTNHFTPNLASGSSGSSSSGGDGCDDCTPPTLGVDNTGVRRVTNGFTYNDDAVNALYYYTPLPLITVNVGEENTAVLRIFEDSGATRVRHAALAFGLSSGQHFAESEAAIRVDIPFSGEPQVRLDDPQNAIDTESLRATVEIGECMAGSAAECLVVTIYHTFREPLDFNVVSTQIWDERRNAWQNFFNHGIEITGESLNPSHGIAVNGGELVLYPLIAGHVDEDGDGIYDYDTRHITYMVDEEYSLYRLAPDGSYQPVRNLYALHHDVDAAIYDDDRLRSHGLARMSPEFAKELGHQEEIAQRILDQMGVPRTQEHVPEFTPSLYESHVQQERMEILEDAIVSEINIAELALQQLYPSMSR